MIGIFNYAHCNVNSLCNALSILSIKCRSSRNFEDLTNCKKIIFPGVGNMKAVSVKNIENLRSKIIKYLDTGGFIYGICLGLQFFFDFSEESNQNTLGLIKGKTKKIYKNFGDELNVQFSSIINTDYKKQDTLNKLFKNLSYEEKFYFLHKYYCDSNDKQTIILHSKYKKRLMPSLFIKNNIIGTQFHPELSKMPGLIFLKNFNLL
jgi:glutamine amidotransferase|tara:strand:+ start:504 stop:1121 length:618 start_codon:yes stop_codon:yes gene_type:complete